MKASYIALALLLVISPLGYGAQRLEDVTRSLVKDIQQAKSNLEKEQAQITKKQNALLDQVHKKAAGVAKLRAQAVSATRQRDEQLLDIKQLSARLNEWQSQANYQQQILLELNQLIHPSARPDSTADMAQSMQQINRYIARQRSALYPAVTVQQVVLPGGEVVNADTLQLGPVTWFYVAGQGIAGLLDSSLSLPEVLTLFSGKQHTQLVEVFTRQKGGLSFDPTLEILVRQKNSTESVLEHLYKGGTWAVPILLFAVIALLIGLAKAVLLFRLPKLLPLFNERIALIGQKGASQSELCRLQTQTKEAQHELVSIALEHKVSQQRDDQLFAYLLHYRHRLERGIGVIALVASVSPLLGLLGTVSGMIETFRMMTLFGAGDPAAVSGGISEALVTTELGLIVAIPALVLHATLNRYVKSRCLTLEMQAIQLSQLELHGPGCQATKEQAA